MEKKLLIMTLCQGERHAELGKTTHPEMLRYARKCGAKFMVANCDGWPAHVSVPWQKVAHLWEILAQWDRVIFFDNDVLINADECPNLFDIVPEDQIGGFLEGLICPRGANIVNVCKENRIPIDRLYAGDYINTGVMVLSRTHRELFIWPDVVRDDFFEQSYINARIFAAHVPIYPLPYTFNRMSVLDPLTGQQRHGSHIVHYAGSNELKLVAKDMEIVKRRWADKIQAETHIIIECTGGIGDVVYAEPVIRWMIEQTYKDRPDVKFTVSTQRPRIFAHFDYPNVKVSSEPFHIEDVRENPAFVIQAHPHTDNPVRAIPFQACHNFDLQMWSMLGDYMPNEAKTPKLLVTPSLSTSMGESKVYALLQRYGEFVIGVHCGRGWESKTFPIPYWQAIVDRLADIGFKVVLFGKDCGLQGVLPIECPMYGVDLRGKLDLGEMFSVLSFCPKLLTNESSPVCISGAFDNDLYLIAQPKAPELVFPYRHGTTSYKTHAIRGPRLSSKAMNLKPNESGRVTIADLPRGTRIEDFLPSVDQVISEIVK